MIQKLNKTKQTNQTKKSKHTKLTKKKALTSKPIKPELEYEAKFLDINHDELVKKIKSLGAILKQPNTIYRRAIF